MAESNASMAANNAPEGTVSATLSLGAQYESLDAIRSMVRELAIKSHVELRLVKSDRSRYTVVCKTEGCLWRLHASLISGGPGCVIKALHDEHTCGGASQLGNKEATAEWVASRYVEKLRDHPMYRPKELMADLRRDLGVSISYKVAWKAKQHALGIIHGDHAKSYGKLQSYCNKLVASNPGTVAHVQQTIEGRFCRMFLAFGACITGFSHCRDFIGLDGTFLTSKYLGALLTATGIDAMGALFPIAFGVVDAENEDNWVWFLQNVRDCMASVNAITFVSDKQKGLLQAVELVFTGCEHAYCMRHLDANLKKKCNNGEFIRLFWVAAYASTTIDYDETILGMKAISPVATEYLLSMSPPSHWATTHFKGKRYGHLTSNIAESLNSWLLEARDKPIISMLDIIRRQLTAWFYARGREGKKVYESLGDRAQFALVANVEKNLREVGNRARQYRILPSSDTVFEILTSKRTCVVDVRTRLCSCNKWQTFEIPCAHAVAAILFKRESVQSYVHKAYTVQAYCDSYCGVINPIVDACEDANDQMKPPATRRPPGHPKKLRIRTEERFKEKRIFTCSRCGGLGHNERTCKAPIAD
ncbi:hypothetical protein L7F22_030049 [Adiantum nelumboides]|nr:hypothetical protein [Adiantum nelumboides]